MSKALQQKLDWLKKWAAFEELKKTQAYKDAMLRKELATKMAWLNKWAAAKEAKEQMGKAAGVGSLLRYARKLYDANKAVPPNVTNQLAHKTQETARRQGDYLDPTGRHVNSLDTARRQSNHSVPDTVTGRKYESDIYTDPQTDMSQIAVKFRVDDARRAESQMRELREPFSPPAPPDPSTQPFHIRLKNWIQRHDAQTQHAQQVRQAQQAHQTNRLEGALQQQEVLRETGHNIGKTRDTVSSHPVFHPQNTIDTHRGTGPKWDGTPLDRTQDYSGVRRPPHITRLIPSPDSASPPPTVFVPPQQRATQPPPSTVEWPVQ